MPRGGKREGAGRKPGSLTRRSREIATNASLKGLTPLEYILEVMRDTTADADRRFAAAVAAAPYVHPRLATVAHSGTLARRDVREIPTAELEAMLATFIDEGRNELPALEVPALEVAA